MNEEMLSINQILPTTPAGDGAVAYVIVSSNKVCQKPVVVFYLAVKANLLCRRCDFVGVLV